MEHNLCWSNYPKICEQINEDNINIVCNPCLLNQQNIYQQINENSIYYPAQPFLFQMNKKIVPEAIASIFL